MNTKSNRPLHKKTLPYIMLFVGLCFGLGIAIDWDIKISGMWDVSFKAQLETEKSAWDIVAAIGSLLAGLGTVGLLAFGWIKAGDWIKEAKHSRKLEFETSLAQTISKHAFDLQRYYNVYLINKVIDGKLSDDQFFYKKLFNEYSIKIEESIVAAKTLVIIYHHKKKQNYIIGLNAQKLKILEEVNDLFKLYEEENHSNDIADLDKKLYEISVENLQLCNFLKQISDEYFVSLSLSSN